MITASENIISIITSPVRKIDAKVEFYLDSTLVETCQCNDRLISFTVERIGDTSKFFGFGICQKLNVHIIDAKRELSFSTANDIKVSYGINGEFIYPYPTFHISEVRRNETTNELSITAYDLMYPDSAHLITDMLVDFSESFTLSNVVGAAAGALGAVGSSIQTSNDVFSKVYNGANFKGTETVREVLNRVAEATQTIYYINSEDVLRFERLNRDAAADFTITKSDYITFDSNDNRRLGKIFHTTELGDNLSISTTQTGTTQYIRDNPFWTTLEPTELAQELEEAIEMVGGLTIGQFDCSWRGNFLLEIGDKIDIVTKDDGTLTTYILDDVFSYNGAFSEESQWHYVDNDNETPETPTSLGDALNQTFAKVDKLNREIELVASNTEGLPEEIASLKIQVDEIELKVENLDYTALEELRNDVASLKITSDSITQDVTKVEETLDEVTGEIETLNQKVSQTVTPENVQIIVKEQLSGGINEVTTTTGYTFNAEGLTITKSGSEMSTQITEDGMAIYRDDTQVLTVNHTGVEATNLHATTYLIIGGLNRFEEYIDSKDQLRIGAFWLLE